MHVNWHGPVMMSSYKQLSTTRSLFQSPICQRCLRLQARRIAGHQVRPIGTKYLAKQAAADEAWQERAKKMEAGELGNPWDLLQERGFVKDTAGWVVVMLFWYMHDATHTFMLTVVDNYRRPEDIKELFRRKRFGAYVGIDPTAQSLHVGHLLPLMPLFWMYFHGYSAVSLIGGATAKIGDPTGRLQSREAIESSTMTMNITKLHYQLKKLWVNVEEQGRRYGFEKEWAWKRALMNNNHWWNKLPMMEVLRRLGQYTRIGPMLGRDTVKRKMTEGDGVSFAEFSYPLMQGWDWWHMFKANGVQMQIGGSDQFGNIVAGVDAVKALRDHEPNPHERLPAESVLDDPVGFTVPLLTDSSGAKFGKSAGNAVWLDPYMTKPFDLYGYFVRRPDADVENLLKLFTFVPLAEIQKTMEEQGADPSKRAAQHLLAFEVTTLIHGAKVAEETRQAHRERYGKPAVQQLPGSGEGAGAGDSPYAAAEGVPTTLNNAPRIDMKLPESLIMGGKIGRILFAAGFVASVSDGTRLAQQKGAYIGGSPGQAAALNKGMPIGQLDFTPVALWYPENTRNFLIDGRLLILRKGRHNVRVIEMVSDDEWKASGQHYMGEPGSGSFRRMKDTLRARMEADELGEAEQEPQINFPRPADVVAVKSRMQKSERRKDTFERMHRAANVNRRRYQEYLDEQWGEREKERKAEGADEKAERNGDGGEGAGEVTTKP